MHRLGRDIDRVTRRPVGRNQPANRRLNAIRQFRHLQPLCRDCIGAPDARATGDGDNSDSVAFRQRRCDQHGRDRHRFVEIVGDDEAIAREHRVIGGRPARHAGGMRGCCALTSTGAADLGNDDRFAEFCRLARRGEKFVDVANALDEQQDYVGRRILHHVVEEFAGAEIGLVAGRDHGAQSNAERLGAVIDRKADPAGLGDDTDTLRGSDQPRLIGLHIDSRAEGRGNAGDLVVVPLRIRSGDPHSRTLGQRRNGILHCDRVAPLLGKA